MAELLQVENVIFGLDCSVKNETIDENLRLCG